MEKLLELLFPWLQCHLVDQLGGETARQCRAEVWRRIAHRAGNMSISEIRGYARALAADALPAEVERVLDRHRLAHSLKDRVLASGIEQIVAMLVRDALSEQYSAGPESIAA